VVILLFCSAQGPKSILKQKPELEPLTPIQELKKRTKEEEEE
jgi:hypothetical protein